MLPTSNPASSDVAAVQEMNDPGLHEHDPAVADDPAADRRRKAFEDDRFGCFVHWGPSTVLSGRWRGRDVPGLAEWIQFSARIPLADYREAAVDTFHPVDFDADAWVRAVAGAGARYLVFVAKHHDGFAMYGSSVSDYNIVDATPFARDPLAELADACRNHGVRLGIYYSHTIDWADPDAVGPQCNDWDFDVAQGRFEQYWERKARPQLEELLTRYGDLAVVWFDMPAGLPAHLAADATELVRRHQPDAAINSRVGPGGTADFVSMDDNYVNTRLPDGAWETAATTNETWSYAADTTRWKSTAELCEAVAHNVARGGNYLLNVGPDPTGQWPEQALAQFATIGEWMTRAAPGIHGSGASPLPSSVSWGHITSRDTMLHLHVCDETRDVVDLPGLLSPFRAAVDVATGADLEVVTDSTSCPGVRLAPTGDGLARTVRVEFDAAPRVTPWPVEDHSGLIRLDASAAGNWPDSPQWKCTPRSRGRFRVDLLSKQTHGHASPRWDGDGARGRLVIDERTVEVEVRADAWEHDPVLVFWHRVRSHLAEVELGDGPVRLRLEGLEVMDSKWSQGINLVALELRRIA